jgi:hypothetical protein
MQFPFPFGSRIKGGGISAERKEVNCGEEQEKRAGNPLFLCV